jgi:outer membrane PBP1 activator LpoA protein
MRNALLSVLISALTVLSACSTLTPAERAAQMEQEVAAMIQVYGPACEKLGYQADSDNWRDCILRLNTDQVRERYQNRPWTTTCWNQRGFYHCTTF